MVDKNDKSDNSDFKITLRILNKQLRVMNGFFRSNKLDSQAKSKLERQIEELRSQRDELIKEFAIAKMDFTESQTVQFLSELRDQKNRVKLVNNDFVLKSLTGKKIITE